MTDTEHTQQARTVLEEAQLPQRASAALDVILQNISALKDETQWRQRLADDLLTRHLESLSEDFTSLIRGHRINTSNATTRDLIVALFYGSIDDTYIGVDSNKPREYLRNYPTLLGRLRTEIGESPLRNLIGCYHKKVVRILPIPKKDLSADFQVEENRASWETYMDENEGVTLLQVDPERARLALRNRAPQLGWTHDVGIWVNTCGLLFEEPHGTEARDLQLLSPASPLWIRYTRYIRDLVSRASRMLVIGDDLVFDELDDSDRDDIIWSLESIFEPELQDQWGAFVAPIQRMQNGMSDFLDAVLTLARISIRGDRPIRLLDAAAGVGSESIWLSQNRPTNVAIFANEIDLGLIKQLKRNERDAGVSVPLYSYDWRHMATKFRREVDQDPFDVIIALGNSLTCLLDPGQMKLCLNNFYKLLNMGGLLVVDERNFRLLLSRNEREIREGFVRSEVIYPGKDIGAKVDPDQRGELRRKIMKLEYYPKFDMQQDRIGTFLVYPFGEGQVEELLNGEGFRVMATYSDLESDDARNGQRDPNACFFSYIAEKTATVPFSSKGSSDERPRDPIVR
jgi:predicted O-methyltransferase YrrM